MTSIYLFILVIYLASVVNDSEWTGTISHKNMKLFSLFCSNKDSKCANTKGNQTIIATQYSISSFKLFNLSSNQMPEELTHCWVSKHIITRWISASCSVSDFEAGVCCNVDLPFCLLSWSGLAQSMRMFKMSCYTCVSSFKRYPCWGGFRSCQRLALQLLENLAETALILHFLTFIGPPIIVPARHLGQIPSRLKFCFSGNERTQSRESQGMKYEGREGNARSEGALGELS